LPPSHHFEYFEIRANERRLLIRGHAVVVGSRALDVLLVLARNPEQNVTKAELLAQVWPHSMVEENNLTVQICNLRKLLGPGAIATIAGRGYRLTVPRTRASDEAFSAGPARLATPPPGPAPAAAALRSTTLFGREGEMNDLRDLLDRYALVTIVGAGGIGKTAMARSVAHARGPAAAVTWVDLSQLSDGNMVCTAIASALKIHLGPAQEDMTQLLAALPQDLLLVLDNAEHLANAVAKVVQAILHAAPTVRLLVTSQVALRLPGEYLCRVAGLAVPSGRASPQAAIGFGAVALFVHRAQTLCPTFALSDDNVAAVIDICRKLDGLPLALELAAVRLPLLGLQGVLQRLHERFKLLACGARLAPDRQQTLHAALDWSHALLPPAQRVVLRRLGVFSGGFTMALATAVAAEQDDDEWTVIEHLDALVDRSLVVVEGLDPPRYRLLETPRAYALEQLEAAGETQAVRQRHALAMGQLCEALSQDFIVESDLVFLKRYRPELDNFRTALGWSLTHHPDCAVALAGALARLHNFLASHLEALAQIEAAERLIGRSTPPLLVARLRVGRALFSRSQSLATALAALREAISLLRALDRPVEFVHAVANVSYRCQSQDAGEVAALCVEARHLCAAETRPNVRFTLAFAEYALAMHHNRLDDMHGLLDECMRLAVAGGYDDYVQLVKWNQAMLAAQTGDYGRARSMGQDIVEFAERRQGNAAWILNGRAVLMVACTGLRRWDDAHQAAQKFCALALPANRFHEFSDVVAFLHAERGDAPGAARLIGYADALCERLQAKRVASFRQRTLELIGPLLELGRLPGLLALGQRMGGSEIATLIGCKSP
jgi:predicted ATPase/DNA-binding winged helix-turn-helix (wHTH) protein